jgi:CheY-like chemotaxis protein
MPSPWHVLFVDDDSEICKSAKEFLEADPINDAGECLLVETATDFDVTLSELEKRYFDMVVLDVKLDAGGVLKEDKGHDVLQSIKQRCFVPVIFYTAVPHLVRDIESKEKPLIQVVEKTEGLEQVLARIETVLATGIPSLNRALVRHLKVIQRDYMWGFVAEHWDQFGGTSDRTALAYLLARRMAMSLSGSGIRQLACDLGELGDIVTAEGRVHPMQYYVMPPVEASPLAGDIYQGRIEEQDGYWVLVTPSCDLVTGREKAEWVLFARCLLLAEQDEYKSWKESLPDTAPKIEGRLKLLLKNRRKRAQQDRFYFLPGAINLPDLVVDFQQLVVLAHEHLGELNRLTSLDDPFADAVLTQFTRFFGRLGTPDLELEAVLTRHRSMPDRKTD